MKGKAGKLNRPLAAVMIMVLLLTVSCGKKKEKRDINELNSHEHEVVALPTKEPEPVPTVDEAGFYACDDNFYVNSETIKFYSEPDENSAGAGEGVFGQQLYRNGYNEGGWYRVYVSGREVFVKEEDVTEIAINSGSKFTYSLASLNIVDSSRQFYSYESMTEDLSLIRKSFPDICRLTVCGLTEDGRNVYDFVIGNPEAKHSILVLGGMEGCEYMTSLFAAKLCEYYAHYADEGIYGGYPYAELLKKFNIHIIPMLNPDGVTISQYNIDKVRSESVKTRLQQWFERDQVAGGTSLSIESYLTFFYGNARGTELTMNFPYGWDEKESLDAPSSKGYKGSAGASENETRDIIKLIEKTDPDLVINLRTSGNSVAGDFGGEGEALTESQRIAGMLSEKFSFENDTNKYGSDMYGSAESYAQCEKGIPAIRINIGNGSAPLSLNEYNSIWNTGRETLAAILVSLLG